jgi:hypothetical protein
MVGESMKAELYGTNTNVKESVFDAHTHYCHGMLTTRKRWPNQKKQKQEEVEEEA